jgi:zinc metalloprotease ZmpB
MVPASSATPAQMAQQLEAADNNLGGWRALVNGLHRKVIYDAFQRRNLTGYPAKAVDVYVDDGRNGGYDWLENYWETQDIWVRPAPYTAAELATASPADHQEPAVGSPAYLYVRVKNKGTSAGGSGPLTVKAYHCIPGMGLVWPDSWSPMDTASLSVANILPGDANARIVGPFKWTPTIVGHECVLVIVECAQDQAVTQTLAPTDEVEHSVLVPFDNNVAQRNLVPVPAKMGSRRGFYIKNPFEKALYVDLVIQSSLPEGWRVHTELPTGQQWLAPLERRWVELRFERPFGADADLSRP